jgi:hypothetical protein
VQPPAKTLVSTQLSSTDQAPSTTTSTETPLRRRGTGCINREPTRRSHDRTGTGAMSGSTIRQWERSARKRSGPLAMRAQSRDRGQIAHLLDVLDMPGSEQAAALAPSGDQQVQKVAHRFVLSGGLGLQESLEE